MGIAVFIVFFFFIIQIVIWINAFRFLRYDKLGISPFLFKCLQLLTGVGLPFFFLAFADYDLVNDCCGESAMFAPDHKVGVYALISIYLLGFSVSVFRKSIFPPLLEVFLNVILMLGLIINGLIAYHISNTEMGIIMVLCGTLPVVVVVLIQLAKNHKMHRTYLGNTELDNSPVLNIVYRILQSNWLYKSFLLFVLCAPVVVLFSLILILFGQKPDTLVEAFTQTYKHGFSQLDYECANVKCGGHFLCSVGALGSPKVVRPVRYGVRKNERIVCTRQLLISNAFEEVIETKLPKFHEWVRRNYNQVGNVIHKYYYWFEIKWVSNTIYVLMKPAEWLFLLVLYAVDINPENRINRQYLSAHEKTVLKMKRIV